MGQLASPLKMRKWGTGGLSNLPRVTQLRMLEQGGQTQTVQEVHEGG